MIWAIPRCASSCPRNWASFSLLMPVAHLPCRQAWPVVHKGLDAEILEDVGDVEDVGVWVTAKVTEVVAEPTRWLILTLRVLISLMAVILL